MRSIFILCAGLAAFAALAACQTTQTAPPVAPLACPPSLTQGIEAQPTVPDGADFDLADTPEARTSGEIYLAYVETLARWGRDGWSRAGSAKAFCESAR
jgi:hypothetical protein